MKSFSLVFFCLFISSYAIAGDAFSNPIILEVRKLHDVAIEGTKEDVQRAEDKINEEIKKNPENQLLRVYLGSLLTVKSSKAFPGPSKYRYLKEGLQMMDTAVETVPNEAPVRFVRAMNNYMLPAFLRRRDDARADFQILVKKINDLEVAKAFDQQTLQAIYYYAGLSFKKSRETAQAKIAWQKGLMVGKTTELGLKMSKELEKIKKG